MSLFVRRCLYISFILIFFIVTPIIIIYASGYKIGNGFKLQKTGVFIVDSKPVGAAIILNGETQKELFGNILSRADKTIKTPAKIKNLYPGEYDVRLELNGYWPWGKKLWINPNESTYLEDVVMFKKALPTIVSQGEYDDIATGRNKRFLAAAGNANFSIIDLNKDMKISGDTASITAPLAWSPSGTKILIGHKVYDIPGPATKDISGYLSGPAKKIAWGDDDSALFCLDGKGLGRIDLNKGSLAKVSDNADIQDFFIKNNELIYVAASAAGAELDIIQLSSLDNVFKIGLPAAVYTFINTDNALINLLDASNSKLYLIDRNSMLKPERDSIANIKQAVWIDDNHLLYANDFEIWIYELSSGTAKILTRISDGIESIAPHKSLNYIIYSTAKTIDVLELDDRERYNITKLVELDKMEQPFVAADGSSVYFLSNIGQQAGVYKLDLE